MRIVHVLGWYFPDSLGGTEVYVAALARHLRGHGHEVFVAAPNSDCDRDYGYRHEGGEVFRYSIPKRPTRREVQGRASTRGADRFHRWLERNKPDLVHCHSLVTGLGLEELERARALGARVIVTCHTPSLGFICQRGTMMRWGMDLCDGLAEPVKCASCALVEGGLPQTVAKTVGGIPQSLSQLGALIPGRLGTAVGMRDLIRHNTHRQHRLLETVDAFVVLTQWAWNTVAANHGSERKLVLNRLGIDLNGVRKRNIERPIGVPVRLGYVGRFHATKGIFVLAEALSQLPRNLPFSLELRGPTISNEDRATQQKLEAMMGKDSRIRFAPAVEHKDVGRVLAEYDVLLCPSTWLEGGPTVAMEAQAVGTPVVGSRIGGLGEIVEDGVNGRLVPAGNAIALATAIAEVAEHPEMVERWRGRLPAPRTMNDVALDYLNLYEACLPN